MDELPFGLERQNTYAKLSASELESIAKQASLSFLCDGVPLNESIVKLAHQHPSISSHQVKRIVEFANQETFSRIFEKQAGDKNVEFPVADPSEVLKELNNGARPNIVDVGSPDYSSGPVKEASAVDAAVADLALAREFGLDVVSPAAARAAKTKIASEQEKEGGLFDRMGFLEKNASAAQKILAHGGYAIPINELAESAWNLVKEAQVYAEKQRPGFEKVAEDLNAATAVENLKSPSPYPEANPYGDLIRAREKVACVFEQARDGLTRNNLLLKEASDEFSFELRQFLLSGGNLGEATHAMHSVCNNSGLVKSAMASCMDDLLRGGVDLVKCMADMATYEMEKGASVRVPNPSNRLTSAFSAMIKLSQSEQELLKSCQTLDSQLQEIDSVLKEAMVRHAP